MVKFFLVIVSILIVTPALALQTISVIDGDTVSVTISDSETSRLSIKDAKIVKAWGAEANLEVIPDGENGELFFIPSEGSKKTFSFFVRDSNGGTYTIAATQKPVQSETIILETTIIKKKLVSKADQKFKDLPYVFRVKSLITSMAQNNAKDEGFYGVVHGIREYVSLWYEVSIMLKSQYRQQDLTGDVYEVINITEEELVLSETEFLNFGDSVVAVAIDHMTLLPRQSTNVYIIRGGSRL